MDAGVRFISSDRRGQARKLGVQVGQQLLKRKIFSDRTISTWLRQVGLSSLSRQNIQPRYDIVEGIKNTIIHGRGLKVRGRLGNYRRIDVSGNLRLLRLAIGGI